MHLMRTGQNTYIDTDSIESIEIDSFDENKCRVVFGLHSGAKKVVNCRTEDLERFLKYYVANLELRP